MDWTPIFMVIFALMNGLFTIFLTRRASTSTASTLESLGSKLDQGIEGLYEQLDPIMKANSRAMGAISHLADDTKMDKALERRIGKDLMGEYDDILEIVKMTFPNVAEYLEDHPEAITKVLPRLNTLISDPDARSRLKLDVKGKNSDISRIWNEERG